MDILNIISWIKNKRYVTSVDPATTLMPIGLKDDRRDDGYLAGVITVENFAAQLTPVPAYKVFTALLTQSGTDNPDSATSGTLSIGRTYEITDYQLGDDFTNVGAPSNANGVIFIATGSTPLLWTNSSELSWDYGAPVVTILENTIGNLWFNYDATGSYILKSSGLFTNNKTHLTMQAFLYGPDEDRRIGVSTNDASSIQVVTTNGLVLANNNLSDTSIEIRVYN